METSNLENTAIQNSLLTEVNKDRWSLIPGTFNQEIYWNHYLWNVTNYWEVLFNNSMPQYEQKGPYVYMENDVYSNLDYSTPG